MQTEVFQKALMRSGFSSTLLPQNLVILEGGAGISELKLKYEFSPTLNIKPVVRYKPNSYVHFSNQFLEREFERFDFLKEWNNLGYGAIHFDQAAYEHKKFSNNEWALLAPITFEKNDNIDVIAEVIDFNTQQKICDYAIIVKQNNKMYLWFNRFNGPVDGYDWQIVENFLSQHTNVYPVVSEVPYGYEGAVTMRIDCDEAIASGRRLFELYKKNNFPFSMAIKTDQPIGESDKILMCEILANSGSIVTHSHTHAINWGGSREKAKWEVQKSHEVFKSLGIEGLNYDYAVSPFHQNPTYAVEGIRDGGLRGFVGGIICNDPQFLMARAGMVPYVDDIISHSQQCMLHGDTYHHNNNTIDLYKKAACLAFETNTFFGFLDHPFSNYWYGWLSEDERLLAHQEFLNFLKQYNLWRANLVDALKFLEFKSKVQITKNENNFYIKASSDPYFKDVPALQVKYKSQVYKLKWGGELVLK